jgi:hypothetical protein
MLAYFAMSLASAVSISARMIASHLDAVDSLTPWPCVRALAR